MKEPKTLREAIEYFSDAENCRKFMVSVLWTDGVVKCPRCGSESVSYLEKAKLYFCKAKHPKQKFSLKVGTIFEDSPIGFEKWLPAFWLLVNCKNGVSSYEVARALGVTQKTAWFMLHRIRQVMQTQSQGLNHLSPHCVENSLQQIIDWHRSSIAKRVPFIERYREGDTSLHIHYRVVFPRIGERNFCAMIQGVEGFASDSAFVYDAVPDLGPCSGEGKTSVFVNVGELIEQPQTRVSGSPGVVRLHLLDECVRLNGNPRKPLECTVRERRILSRLQGVAPDRKSAVLLPVRGQDCTPSIHLDQIESDVIQGGSQLIDKFPGQHGNDGRRFEQVECFFAIRFSNETVTIAGNILGDGILDGFKVLDGSLDF